MPFMEQLITPVIEVEGTAVEELMLQAPYACKSIQFSSVQFSLSVVSDSLGPHGLQLARLLCPSPTPRACSDSCPCHPTISSSVIPFSTCLQSFPTSGSFPVIQFFASGGQILEFQLQHQSFQRIYRINLL